MFFKRSLSEPWWLRPAILATVIAGLFLFALGATFGLRIVGLAFLVDCAAHYRNPRFPTEDNPTDPDAAIDGFGARALWLALGLIGLAFVVWAGPIHAFILWL